MEKIGINRYGCLVLIALASTGYSIDLTYSTYGQACRRREKPALHEAAKKGQNGVVEQLLAAGADINAKDDSGETALHCAARAGHSKIVRVLIAKGADVNAKDVMA